MKTHLALTLFLILGIIFNTIAQIPDAGNILYVNASVAGGNGSGDSWENAMPQLADALKYAKQQNNYTSGNPLKIYVAKGTYKPIYSPIDGENLDTPADARSAAFLLVKNVQLYGGFDPNGGNTDINTRILPSVGGGTILSGDIDNNNTLDNGNAYHVVIAVGDLDAALIDGFTISDGYADNSMDFPMISNEFIYLDSGAGMLISGLLTFSSEQAKIAINHCNFSNNSAVYTGGGMFTQLALVDIQNSSFKNNTCTSDAGGMYNTASDLTITNCTFDGNRANTSRGGAIFNDGASVIANNTILSNNTAGTEGAGLYNSNAPIVQLNNCSLKGNEAGTNGGGVYSSGSGLTLNNVAITNNMATNKGGGFYFDSGLQTPVFTNVTIANNNSNNGNAVYVDSEALILQYKNAIVFGDVAQNYTAQYSLIEGNTDITPANGNMSANGLTTADIFADATNGNYTLTALSPVVNAGNNTFNMASTDLAGNSRIYNGGIIDLGAYEYQGDPIVLPVTLINFTAKADGNRAKLQWQTASESSNKGFIIYRSGDGLNFVQLNAQPIKGNAQQSYTFTDKTPTNGKNYYKLVQIDNDGKTTDLGVRTVSFNFKSSTFSLYPNPTTNQFTVTFEIGKFSQLEVTDITGKILQHIMINTTESSKVVSLGIYPAGVYIVKLSGKGKTESRKIIRR